MSLDFCLIEKEEYVLDKNITHNLNVMADKAGIYDCLWRPSENGFKYAKDIIPTLEKGLSDMKKRPEYFKQWNSSNGWGLYKHFIPWLEDVLKGCKDYPNAEISVSV